MGYFEVFFLLKRKREGKEIEEEEKEKLKKKTANTLKKIFGSYKMNSLFYNSSKMKSFLKTALPQFQIILRKDGDR